MHDGVAQLTMAVSNCSLYAREHAVVADLTQRAKESARRGYETSLRQNGYWLRRLQSIHMLGGDPKDILTRSARIDGVTPEVLRETFRRYLAWPERDRTRCDGGLVRQVLTFARSDDTGR